MSGAHSSAAHWRRQLVNELGLTVPEATGDQTLVSWQSPVGRGLFNLAQQVVPLAQRDRYSSLVLMGETARLPGYAAESWFPAGGEPLPVAQLRHAHPEGLTPDQQVRKIADSLGERTLLLTPFMHGGFWEQRVVRTLAENGVRTDVAAVVGVGTDDYARQFYQAQRDGNPALGAVSGTFIGSQDPAAHVFSQPVALAVTDQNSAMDPAVRREVAASAEAMMRGIGGRHRQAVSQPTGGRKVLFDK